MNPQSAIRNPQSLHPFQALAQLFVNFAGVPLEAMIIRLYDRHSLRLAILLSNLRARGSQ